MDGQNLGERRVSPDQEYLEPTQNVFDQFPFDEIFETMAETYPDIHDQFADPEGWLRWVYWAIKPERGELLDFRGNLTYKVKKMLPPKYKEAFMSMSNQLRDKLEEYPLLLEYFSLYKAYFPQNGEPKTHFVGIPANLPTYLHYVSSDKNAPLLGVDEEFNRQEFLARARSRSHVSRYWQERQDFKNDT